MIGSKLAHYEITSHLGTGGMGEVYQATDSKLGRSVAIKLLPEAFAHDTDRATRFGREARVLASLNHPRIAAIYGIEETNDRKFLVMELIAGDTLEDRIARGPLPLDEALKVAAQIAEAMEAAHEKGVIHRDLKPANIKFTADGQIKVLDFGLAKALTTDAPQANAANSPTLMSMAANSAGIILGTAAYMSPEQAKGMPVDTRTDVFAFGCVLYEMLTGTKAFSGDTVSDILAGVLRAEVDWSRLPANLPPAVRRLLHRCLRKDRQRRLQTATDVRNELEDALREPEEKPLSQTVSSPPSKRRWIPWAATFILAISAGVLAVPYFRPPADTPEMRLDVSAASTSDPVSFAVSPNGKMLVYAATADGQSRLWIRRLDSLTATALAGTEGGLFPFWSPDSKSIGFFASGKLMRIDIAAGRPQALAPAGTPRGGSWNAAGEIIFTASSSGVLARISASSGGQPVAITKLGKGHTSHRFPSFLPDGQHFLFFIVGTPDVQGIYFGSLDSNDLKFITAADTSGVYRDPGYLLFVRQGTLVAQRFDLVNGTVSGDFVTVADPVGFDSAYSAGGFSASSTGIVAYRPGSPRNQFTWFDRSGKPAGLMGPPDSNGLTNPVLSPDGNRATSFRTIQGNTDIYILDAVRTSRFTSDPSSDRYAVWARDGRIFFDSNRKGHRDLYVAPSDRTSAEELLFESGEDKVMNDLSADGRSLLYVMLTPSADLRVLPLDEKGKAGQPYSFLSTMFEERQGQFSPDGHWIAYESTESGSAYEIYVRPFPGPGGQYPISTGGGVQPRWSYDGKEIYYIAPDGKLMAVSIATKGGALEPGKPVELFQPRLWGGGTNASTGQQYAVSRDGRFLMNIAVDDAVSSPITLLLNWKPPAK